MPKWIVFRIALPLMFVLQPIVDCETFAAVSHYKQNVEIEIAMEVLNPCAPEMVFLTGTIHVLMHVTEDEQTGQHIHAATNFQDVSGVGLTSGIQYRAMDSFGNNSNSSGPSDQLEQTQNEPFGLISQGSTDNLRGHVLFHFTSNGHGEATAEVVRVTLRCKNMPVA